MTNTIKRRHFIKSASALGSLLFFSPLAKGFGAELPEVFIIGDSISMGYTPFVKTLLDGKANVSRPDTNCGSTFKGMADVNTWLGGKKFKVIYFNFGLHDLRRVDPLTKASSTKESDPTFEDDATYAANLTTIVTKLKTAATTVIFATTTPVSPTSGTAPHIQDRPQRFNAIAIEVMKKNGVIVDDLFNFALPQLSDIQLPTNLHYTKKGYEVLAGRVAATIAKYI